ncbi:anti-sigma factor family protein [Dyella amyloliquefaciens]|uniref:anti-sigma factor family protein n=1 Tax=Dyella amyloliquefaciens TaxID=1770545 RepID=UPI00102E8E25|nr:zf-HC2 domain-containing protein [Dyella amyloliquefaciens]
MKLPTDIGKDCARAWDAMPWSLQNSATRDQDEWLNQHLAQCEACRSEFELQSRLRLAISLPQDVPVDVDAGLRRLLARIDAPDTRAARQRSRTSWVTRALVAAVLVQAIGIGVLGARLWSEASQADYRTLSQASAPLPTGAMHVVPDDTMKLADWDTLLHTFRLQVIGGPNEVGAYTVVASDGSTSSRDTLQKLRTTHGIRLAEPVANTP